MNLYVMRHGESDYNVHHLCNDDPLAPVFLTDKGIQQAKNAAQNLLNKSITQIISSPLPRAVQTARIVNAFLQVNIKTHPMLNDIRSGYDGKPVSDYQAAIRANPLTTRPSGGDSLLEHKARIKQFVGDVLVNTPETRLLVAHEETLRVFKAIFEQLEDQQMLYMSFENCQILHFSTDT